MSAIDEFLYFRKQIKVLNGIPYGDTLHEQAAAELAALRAGYVEIFVFAIAGRADAAIVANQEFDARHVILEVKTLAEEHRKLRAELDEKNKFIEMAFVAHPNLDLDINYITNHDRKKDA